MQSGVRTTSGPAALRRRSHRRGFTLVEAAIVTVIIGVGIVAVMQLLAAGTLANAESTGQTTAIGLVTNIRERAMRTPYFDDPTTAAVEPTIRSRFHLKTFSPPIDALGSPMSSFTGWAQVVEVRYVDPNNLTLPVPDSQVEPTSRITVKVTRNGSVVYTTSWLVAAPVWPPPTP